MVEFNPSWYKSFIESTNEKDLLVNKIASLLEGKPSGSCLEIGLGLSPYFAEKLSPLFQEYIIVEKLIVAGPLPKSVQLINEDWETLVLKQSFDVILASHVVYYFHDKKSAIRKMLDSLSTDGRVLFVVNGKESDYGPLKLAFSKMINRPYIFTYEELVNLTEQLAVNHKEYTLPSVIEFDSYEKLYETLRLSFDHLAEEYNENKEKILEYLRNNIKGGRFIIDQKIIEVSK